MIEESLQAGLLRLLDCEFSFTSVWSDNVVKIEISCFFPPSNVRVGLSGGCGGGQREAARSVMWLISATISRPVSARSEVVQHTQTKDHGKARGGPC